MVWKKKENSSGRTTIRYGVAGFFFAARAFACVRIYRTTFVNGARIRLPSSAKFYAKWTRFPLGQKTSGGDEAQTCLTAISRMRKATRLNESIRSREARLRS